MLIVIIALVFILFLYLGNRSLYYSLCALRERMVFAVDFREKYISFSNKYFSTYDRWEHRAEIDQVIYIWLMKNVNRIQIDLGSLGLVTYADRLAGFQSQAYPLVLNTIPKFRDFSVLNNDAAAVDDCLLRYIGSLEELIKKREQFAKNPIEWFKKGVSIVLSFPFELLSSFGVLGSDVANKLVENRFFKFFSNLASFVSFVYGIYKFGLYVFVFFAKL